MPMPADATAAAPQQPKPEPAKSKPKSDRIGDILRHARLERNDDLYQIADYLCIKPAFLVALENSRYDEFPADAYVIGFLRTYANFLGVDGKDAVDRYRYEMAGRRKKPVLAMPIPLSEGRAPGSLVMVAATVAVLMVYALWYGISSANRTEVNVPPPLPPAQQIAPAPAPSSDAGGAAGLTAPVTTPAPVSNNAPAVSQIPPAAPGIVVTAGDPKGAAAATTTILKESASNEDAAADKAAVAQAAASDKPADKKDADKNKTDSDKKQVYGDPTEAAHLIIRATQTSWVLIEDASGKSVFDHVLKAGDIYKVPNQPGLTLTTGNGNGLVLLQDGAELPKVATGAPHVVKNIPLDPDKLTVEPPSD